MADDKRKRNRQQDAEKSPQDGSGLADAWERHNAAENELYAEIAKNPDFIPIPGEDGNPAEAILYTGNGDISETAPATGIMAGAMRMLSTAKAIANADAAQTIQQAFSVLQAYLESNGRGIKEVIEAAQTLKELEPYIAAELEERNADPEFSKLTVNDLLSETDENGNPIKSIWSDILEKAAQRAGTQQDEIPLYIPEITATEVNAIILNIDKIDAGVWNLLQSAEKNGQLSLNVDMSPEGQPAANVIYGINFDDLGENVSITKQLTPFDRRVYTAVSALYNGGNGEEKFTIANEVFSITQIYQKMGFTGRPGKRDVENIQKSLTKMAAAHIYINNDHERSVHKKRKKFVYDASLLPMERMSAYINGVLTDAAIHLLREPPLTTFAKQRKQITTFDLKLLQSPISKTNQNLMIDDYLIERIAHMKKDKKQTRKMLYSTIYRNCKITTQKQKERAPDKIWRYLEYYRECNHIKGFKKLADGVEIIL